MHGYVSQDLPSFHFVVLSMLASVLGFITHGHKMVSKALGNHSNTGKKNRAGEKTLCEVLIYFF